MAQDRIEALFPLYGISALKKSDTEGLGQRKEIDL
jgi:hypothetical protein